MPKKPTRLKQTTILTLPEQIGSTKHLPVWFPAHPGARMRDATITIEKFSNSGNVEARWVQKAAFVRENSPFGGGVDGGGVFGALIGRDPVVSGTTGKPRKSTTAPGGLILVTVTVTVPPRGNDEEVVEKFEIEATTIDLP
ncbi:MAG: hypothetical protein ACKOEO_04080 [Planctomycetaceae bacterium]